MQFKHPQVVATWPKPNLIDPVRRGPELYIVNSIFFSLTTLVLMIRLYTRIFVRRWVGLDDALIITAWVRSLEFALHQKVIKWKTDIKTDLWNGRYGNNFLGIFSPGLGPSSLGRAPRIFYP